MKNLIFILLLLPFAGYSQTCDTIQGVPGKTQPVYGVLKNNPFSPTEFDTLCWYWNRNEIKNYFSSNSGTIQLNPTQICFGGYNGKDSSSRQYTYDPQNGSFIVGFNGAQYIAIDTAGSYYKIGDISGATKSDAVFYINSTSSTTFTAGITTNFGDYIESTESYINIGDIDNNVSTTFLKEDYVNSVAIQTNAIASPTMQVDNGSGVLTINNGVRGLYYDPPTLTASVNITTPSSPADGQEIIISFGGQISGSGVVCSSATLLANISQRIFKNPLASLSVKPGDTYVFKYRLSNLTWYCISSF